MRTSSKLWISFFVVALMVGQARAGLIIRYTFDVPGFGPTGTGQDSATADGYNHDQYNDIAIHDTGVKVQGPGSGEFYGLGGNLAAQNSAEDPLNNLGDGVTYAFWVRIKAASSGLRWILRWDDGGDNSPFCFYTFNANSVHYQTSAAATVFTPGVLSMDQWYHIAVVHDFRTNTAKMYLDGVLGNTAASFPDVATSINNDYFRLGAAGGHVAGFIGHLDDMQIYRGNVANAQEIEWLATHPGDTISDMRFGTMILIK